MWIIFSSYLNLEGTTWSIKQIIWTTIIGHNREVPTDLWFLLCSLSAETVTLWIQHHLKALTRPWLLSSWQHVWKICFCASQKTVTVTLTAGMESILALLQNRQQVPKGTNQKWRIIRTQTTTSQFHTDCTATDYNLSIYIVFMVRHLQQHRDRNASFAFKHRCFETFYHKEAQRRRDEMRNVIWNDVNDLLT